MHVSDESGKELSSHLYGYDHAGEMRDVTGMQYLRARYLDTNSSSFISQDPYEGELENPLSKNGYTYAENDPINNNDPSGNGILGWIKSKAKKHYNRAKKAVKKAVNRARRVARSVRRAVSKARSGIRRLGRAVKRMAKRAYRGAKNLARKAKRLVKRAIKSAKGFVKNTWNKAKSTAKNAWNKAKQAGKNVYNWGKKKVKEAKTMVKKAVKTVVKAAKHVCTSVKRIAKQSVSSLKKIDWKDIGFNLALIVGAGIVTAGLASFGVPIILIGALVGGATNGIAAYYYGKKNGMSGKELAGTVATETVVGMVTGAILPAGSAKLGKMMLKRNVGEVGKKVVHEK